MKELIIEQKAQRYDKALAKAKTIVNSINVGLIGKDSFEAVFPEFKENKEESTDEKVRKALIKLVTNHASMDLFIEYDIHLDEALSWLEKQGKNNMGISESVKQKLESNLSKALEKETPKSWNKFLDEQKPGDKAEPKFKAGDWAVSKFDGKARQISEVHYDEYNNYYVVGSHEYDIEDYDRLHYLWTIQDAKAGDVLADDYGIYIFEKFDECDKNCYVCIGAYQYSQKVYECEHMLCSTDAHPATKEQCNLLFQKMKEAGYEWNAEKKELGKIEQEENAELTDFESALFSAFSYAWQEYLSGKEVNVAKWAKEHSAELLEVAREQKSAVWSEEDESMRTRCIGILARCYMGELPTKVEEELNWFKSLKDRYTWKPSDGQMDSITCAVRKMKESACYDSELVSLFNDLKKLKG